MNDQLSEDSVLIEEGEYGADYLEKLLDILDYDGDIDIDVKGSRASISIVGESEELRQLVGKRGKILEALQELTRLFIQKSTGRSSLLMLDISSYRLKRKAELEELAKKVAQEVLSSQKLESLEPMSSFERKVIHDTISHIQGVVSYSDGLANERHIIISPE